MGAKIVNSEIESSEEILISINSSLWMIKNELKRIADILESRLGGL